MEAFATATLIVLSVMVVTILVLKGIMTVQLILEEFNRD